MKRAENREDDQADEHEMEMRDEIIAVLGLPIERGDRVTDPRQAREEKLHERGDAEEHRACPIGSGRHHASRSS